MSEWNGHAKIDFIAGCRGADGGGPSTVAGWTGGVMMIEITMGPVLRLLGDVVA